MKILHWLAVALSAWNTFLACAVCQAFAGYLWDVDSIVLKQLITLPMAIVVFVSSYFTLTTFPLFVLEYFAWGPYAFLRLPPSEEFKLQDLPGKIINTGHTEDQATSYLRDPGNQGADRENDPRLR